MAHDAHGAKSFKDTLNLPKTDFPIRANAAVEDAALIERWTKEELFRRSFTHNQGAEKYILHDGPPYANGDIHLGHAYNKILKDMVGKSRRMAGYHVPITPGWDCHGLPIELKVTQALGESQDRQELIKACRLYATHWIERQRESFKKLGVLMDWDNPYLTMDPSYEAAVVKALGDFVAKGYIERKNKTVPWCPECHTVLAAAEIEHKERKDPSIYVLFPLSAADQKRLFGSYTKPVNFLVWTTTPWTLPLNRAVALNPRAKYVLLELKDTLCIVGAHVADQLCALLDTPKHILGEFDAQYFEHVHLDHPFLPRTLPVIFDDSVGTSEGTAAVHIAPGCGPSDYEIGVKNGLEIYSPITPHGQYADTIEPVELAGMPVSEGQIWVIKKLAHEHRLLYKTSITHSYPYCWRSHTPLIFRATPQWFFNLDALKHTALAAIETLAFIPAGGCNFLRATLENRWEWCLSRQRVWGVPIPALVCTACDKAYTSPELIARVAEKVAHEGIEYWQHVSVHDLVGSLQCAECGAQSFRKEQDILDVWFESGLSHYAVLYHNNQLAYPADIYLEGVDQHRAWFQSSLLTSLVLEEEPCTRAFMTHGYTVDAKGHKMSKSLGNVVAPEDIIKQIGTDGLRLWVASVGNESDPSVSQVLFRNVSEVYRKIRNTCRFLLSNLYDFDIQRDRVAIDRLLPIDTYALSTLVDLNHELRQAYQETHFTHVFHGLADYCTSELSSFYLDISKDRLYTEAPTGHARRSAQTAYWYILDTLTRLMAPVLSFTAEHIADHYQADKRNSIHLQPFADLTQLSEQLFAQEPVVADIPAAEHTPLADDLNRFNTTQQVRAYALQWQELKAVRSVILKSIEAEREKGLIKHSLEAHVTLYIDLSLPQYKPLADLFNQLLKQGIQLEEFLKELLIVSQFTYAKEQDTLTATGTAGIYVRVEHALGTKCPRCWNWEITQDPDGLDARCQRVLGL